MTVNRLQALDPHEIFTSPLLRTLMRPRGRRGRRQRLAPSGEPAPGREQTVDALPRAA